jgi:ABC-type transport system involved in multi-copper enzyme maturation permease subunit
VTYLLWRQHRAQAAIALGALLVLAAVLLASGVQMASSYHSALRTCGASGTCGSLADDLFHNDGLLFDLVAMTLAVPALFGLFWGAPLVARELEEGTQQLAWMQGVTRRRWLAAKVTAMLAAAAVWGAAISALVTWWSGPVNALHQYRFNLGHFDSQGLVPVGYAVFAVALGITVGTVLRRVLPALATTLALFVAVRFAVDYALRRHYMAPVRVTSPIGTVPAALRGSAWQLTTSFVTPAGRPTDRLVFTPATMPARCAALFGPQFRDQVTRCLGAIGWRTSVTYQPAGRFWAFQGIELGIYLALAAALVVVAFVVISRRDA